MTNTHCIDDKRQAFIDAIDDFKQAAYALQRAWESGFEVDGYPEGMPDFDEFVARLADFHAADAVREER